MTSPMTLPEYRRPTLWGGWEKFAAATDEQVAEWLVIAKETDATNKAVHLERVTAYQSVLAQVKELFGGYSKQYKYLLKNPITPQWDNYTRQWEDYNQKRKEHLWKTTQKAEHDAKILRIQNEREQKERAALLTTWEIATRRSMKITVDLDPEELMLTIIQSDRYLELAHAMMKTRGDWSEGFYRVERALSSFVTKTDGSEQDKAIISDISSCFDADDGRVFRDTEWGYDKLYTLVDQQTLKDYEALGEFVRLEI